MMGTTQSLTPSKIKVRHFNKTATKGAAEYYFDNDPFKTQFMNALSATFPEGERFFIKSVLAYRDQIDDPKLLADIKDFCFQEAQHTLVHEGMNELAAKHGYPMKGIDDFLKGMLRAQLKRGETSHRWRRWNLAKTVCLEHFTAILAYQVLTRGNTLFAGMDANVRALYAWHAVEETEHKSVAFDVYKSTGGSGWVLRLCMLTTSFEFVTGNLQLTYQLLKHRRQHLKLANWWSGFKFLMLPPRGALVRVLPDWLAFFAPGFHPWKQHRDLQTGAAIAQLEGFLTEPAVAKAA